MGVVPRFFHIEFLDKIESIVIDELESDVE